MKRALAVMLVATVIAVVAFGASTVRGRTSIVASEAPATIGQAPAISAQGQSAISKPALPAATPTVADLLAVLRDRSRSAEHRDALNQLAAIGTAESLAGVFESFIQRRSLIDARDAAAALVQHPSSAAIDGLRDYLGDDRLVVRVSALEVLGELSRRASADLKPAIRDALASHAQTTLTAARAGGPSLRKAATRIANRLGSQQ